MEIINLYVLLIPFIFYFILKVPFESYQPREWGYKVILIYITLFFYVISIFKSFPLIDNLILPALLFTNIAILIYITLSHEYNIVNLIPLIGILYLLYTFNYKDFQFNHGILINVNRKWILSHIVILILWYLTTKKSILTIKETIFCILWILYPLLFPMNEYWIHRVFILALVLSIGYGTDIRKYILDI